jgi:hypothetical protein
LTSRIVSVLGRLRAGLLLFAVVAGFYWKLTLTRQFDWLWGSDVAGQVLPWFQEQARAWSHGRFPLWDPYMWAGQPLIGQAQPGGAYPLNWILFALPLHDGHIMRGAIEWYFVAIRLMAAAFCYLLCRDLGRSRAASLAGACVYSLAGYIAVTGWPQMVNGAVWLPLVLLFLLRAVRGSRTIASAALSGMFLGMAWLSGHHQAPLFASLASAGVWLYFIFRQGRPDRRLVKAAAVAAVVTVFCGALQIVPAWEYGHRALRWAGGPSPSAWNDAVPYYVHEQQDLKAGDLLGIVFPNIGTHTSPYIGAVALALALLAIGACWRDSRVRLMAGLGLGALAYALAHYSLLNGLLYSVVPSLDKARVPAAAVVIFELAAAVLAAFGLDRLGSGDDSPGLARVRKGALWFGLFTLAVVQAVTFANRMSFPLNDGVILTAVTALLLAALLGAAARGSIPPRQVRLFVVLLLLFDLGIYQNTTIASRYNPDAVKTLEQMSGNADVAAFLKRQPGYQRTAVAYEAFFPNWGAWHGVEMWGGYLASISTDLFYTTVSPQARLLYGVAYTVAERPAPELGEDLFTGASGAKVYRNAGAFPRAWAVHSLRRVPDLAAGRELIAGHLADLHSSAFVLEAPPAVEYCAGADDVILADHQPDRVLIRARMSCKGMVVLSDTFFPGWEARIDGAPAAIYEVNGAMRGVVVPAGSHAIAMQYRPASVMAGAGLSFIGFAGTIGLAAFGRRFRRRPNAEKQSAVSG